MASQLEDLDILQTEYDQLDADYKKLEDENESLSNEVLELTDEINTMKGTLKDCISRLNCIIGDLQHLE